MERTIYFRYFHDTRAADANKLKNIFEKDGNKYVIYAEYNGYIEIIAQRVQGETWNNLMRKINSVHSARYRFKNTIIIDNREHIYITCPEVITC